VTAGRADALSERDAAVTDIEEIAGNTRRPSPAFARLDAMLAAERCVVLDGGTATELPGVGGPGAEADEPLWGTRALIDAPDTVLRVHKHYVEAGCDVISTNTWGLASALSQGGPRLWDSTRPVHWMDIARRGLALAREAVAEAGREGECAIAFSVNGDVDTNEGRETIPLLARLFGDDPPDLILLETLSLLRPSLDETIESLLATGLPVWLSFRRCRHGLCGVYGQHWGGPEGDAFARAARRFEALGVDALLLGCIPPDHVDGMLSYLRDFTDLPLGVHPNLGYLTSNGWHVDDGAGSAEFAHMALRWREEGAQLIGGCCGVGSEQIGAARAALAGTRPGGLRRDEGGSHELGGVRVTPPEPWVDAAERSLYPLAFPDLVAHGGSFVPTQGSFLVWRHLFREQVGRGRRCLDVGCGSGLQAIQLALNGAERVDAIDVDSDAKDATLLNAFRNGVVDRVSVAAVDLFLWMPETRYDVIVASLFQTPVDPLAAVHADRPVDYWGRNAVDHLIRILPRALADDGVAYILQASLLSQERTTDLLARRGLQARVVDFGFLPVNEHFRQNAEQIARVERMSDAHHLEICGSDVMVGYLLEITRMPSPR
jgi:S-methylmethionine-dependent homocysteine/selenocysteine methylase/SAM-dependent methyltransferase